MLAPSTPALPTVEPFTVTCETCHARLKVRGESVVGEIHACPKCGSMVHILPPTGSVTVTSQTASIELEPLPAQSAPEAVAPLIAFTEAVATPAAPVAAAGTPLSFWLIGAASIALVGGLSAAMWLGGSGSTDKTTVIAASAAVTESVEQSPPAHEEPASDARSNGRDPYAVDDDATSTDVSPQTDADDSKIDPIATTDAQQKSATSEPQQDQPEADNEPAEEAFAAPSPTVAKSDPSPTASTPPTERRHEPVLKFDPLDFDPSQLSLGGSANSTPSAGSITDKSVSETEAADAPPINKNADEATLPRPAMDHTLSVRLGPTPSGGASSNLVAKQLALPVETLDVTDMSLARFIDTVSDMAGAPVALDPVALELAGISPRQAVSVQASGVTLERLLTDALSKQRLALVEHEGRLRVALVDADRRSSKDYEVKDLAGAGSAKQVAELIERFVAPQSWQPAGGGGQIEVEGTKLHIAQSRANHHQVLIFCERLRLARGLALRSRYPADRLSVESPYARIADKLNQRTIFTFLPWARLADVVRQWEDASGLTILVGWSALADIDLGPASPLACSAIDRTWADVLDRILEPIGLAWWAVDGETIQISTREALDDIQRIEFYAVPKPQRDQFASNEALIESLQEGIKEHASGNHSNAQQPLFVFDEPSDRLIVLADPNGHRQLSQRLRDK